MASRSRLQSPYSLALELLSRVSCCWIYTFMCFRSYLSSWIPLSTHYRKLGLHLHSGIDQKSPQGFSTPVPQIPVSPRHASQTHHRPFKSTRIPNFQTVVLPPMYHEPIHFLQCLCVFLGHRQKETTRPLVPRGWRRSPQDSEKRKPTQPLQPLGFPTTPAHTADCGANVKLVGYCHVSLPLPTLSQRLRLLFFFLPQLPATPARVIPTFQAQTPLPTKSSFCFPPHQVQFVSLSSEGPWYSKPYRVFFSCSLGDRVSCAQSGRAV